MAYYDTYRDQLASLHHGHALWAPNPAGLYDQVTVGDVGYVRQGHFLRMFNALLPANDPAQVYGVPDGYVPLNMGPFQNMRTMNLDQGDYCSSTVSIGHHGAEREAAAPLPVDATITLFKSKRDKGGAFYPFPFMAKAETLFAPSLGDIHPQALRLLARLCDYQ